jgi:hypothetical protein
MEGGIAILLLLVLVAIGGAFAVAFTSLGTALGLRQDKEAQDADAGGGRPVHTEPTTPYHEHARFSHQPEEHESAQAEHTRD